MKQKLFFIFLLLIPSLVKTADKKTLSIVIAAKKTTHQHRLIFPLIATLNYTPAFYLLISALIASIGNINFCLPSMPEIILNEDINILKSK